ncbi:phosphoribosylanthranilate isomerase [Cesiribacter sp. SM1]|uniref:phosphoribosylanthranilate isomerase n=1 Tax=Cesiribacter sp. SM1 TaxID=2861196 RepID=UPI001CD62A9C|nr:phosphoribosylanthranilate isomerase [Cesiribacter sp. SM1]
MERSLKVKVCGMKDPENLQAVAALQPDYLGFIFFEKSPRYMPQSLNPEDLDQLPRTIKRVGVFVNAPAEEVLEQARRYGLQAVQLHGDEPPALCRQLQQQGLQVIKVFRVGERFNLDELLPFADVADYFLFDTQGKQYGGNGKAFDWELIKEYSLQVPVILSGGVALGSLDHLNQLQHLPIHALDVNSKFETAPGFKNIPALQELLQHPVLLADNKKQS